MLGADFEFLRCDEVDTVLASQRFEVVVDELTIPGIVQHADLLEVLRLGVF
jgi:hypothetical protein